MTSAFERPPESVSSPDASEQSERRLDAWMEHPAILEHGKRDVGEIISELQQNDEAVYACLPLPTGSMQGLVRMYVSGVEEGRLLEDLQEEVSAAVRQTCKAKRAA